MSRLPELTPETMTPEQRQVYDRIVGGPRGGIGGPFLPWLHSPILADRAQSLGEFCRFHSALPSRLSELAILVTGRFWRAQFEWYMHARMALKAGVAPEIIAAIEAKRTPSFVNRDEEIVYTFATELHTKHEVGDVTYATARAVLGDAGVVDLVAILGYYTLVSMTLNVFQVPVPGGTLPLAD